MPLNSIKAYEKAIISKYSPTIIATMRAVVESCYKGIFQKINPNRYAEIYFDFKKGDSDPIPYSKKVRSELESEIGTRCFTAVYNLLGNSNHEGMTQENGDLLISLFEKEWKEIAFYTKKYLELTIPYHGIKSKNNNSFFDNYYQEIIKSLYSDSEGTIINGNRIQYLVEEVNIIHDSEGNFIFENIARAWYQSRGNKSTKITFYSKEKLVPSNCYTAIMHSIELDGESGIKYIYAKEIKYSVRKNVLSNIERVCKVSNLSGSEFDNLMKYLLLNSISLFTFLNYEKSNIMRKYDKYVKSSSKKDEKIIDKLINIHEYMQNHSHARLLIYCLDDEIHNRMLYENLNEIDKFNDSKGQGYKEYSLANILHTGISPFDNDPIIFNPYQSKLPLSVKVEMVTNRIGQKKMNFRLSIIYYAINSVSSELNTELLPINDEILFKINSKIIKYVKIIKDLEEYKKILEQINKETKLSEDFYCNSRIYKNENSCIVSRDIDTNKNIFEGFQKMLTPKHFSVETDSIIKQYKTEFENLEEEIDSNKIEALNILRDNRILVINGAAGTGKSLLLRFVSELYNSKEFDVYAIAQTNAAKENLEQIVPKHVQTYTTTKFINNIPIFRDKKMVIILDEAGVISNNMIEQILCLDPDVLIIAGDYYQLPSIKIGNWFETICKIEFIPKIELTNNYRSNDTTGKLLSQWKAFRERKSDKFISLLDNDNFLIFEESVKPFEFLKNLTNKKETSIVSLGYSGILGVNNCNYIIQLLNNPKKEIVRVNSLEFKEGDKVLFDTNSVSNDYYYNNLKGKILKIVEKDDYIDFQVETNRSKKIEETSHLKKEGLLIKCEKTKQGYKVILNIRINKYNSENENGIFRPPFHISYSNSIHKSQGLEYKTILIVTSPYMEDMNFNILYTAITRAKENFILLTNPENFSQNINRIFEESPRIDSILKKIILSKGRCLDSYKEA